MRGYGLHHGEREGGVTTMLSSFEERLQAASSNHSKVWDLIRYLCEDEFGPHFSFEFGTDFNGETNYYARFGEHKATSNSPAMAVLKAAIKAME
jgi:hypothetical protein